MRDFPTSVSDTCCCSKRQCFALFFVCARACANENSLTFRDSYLIRYDRNPHLQKKSTQSLQHNLTICCENTLGFVRMHTQHKLARSLQLMVRKQEVVGVDSENHGGGASCDLLEKVQSAAYLHTAGVCVCACRCSLLRLQLWPHTGVL